MSRKLKGELKENREEKQVEWKIPDFSSLSRDKKSYYNSSSFTYSNASWHLSIYPGGDKRSRDGYFSLYLSKETGSSTCSVIYTFGIKKTDGTFFGKKCATYTFSDLSWGYPDFFQRSEFLERESELLPSGVLTITCNLKMPCQAAEITEGPMELLELEKLSENLQELLTSNKSYDTTIKVMNKDFGAHRLILAARSSVFAAMFEHDTFENQSGIIYIPDCDPESFEDFLKYLYTGKSKNISSSNVLHLYETAEKYDVQELKSFCGMYIIQNLMVDNFFDATLLANQYEDARLVSAVQDFFNRNMQKIFLTEKWDYFLRENYDLAKMLLTEMSKKAEFRH